MEKEEGVVYPSLPPKRKFTCTRCGNITYLTALEELTKEQVRPAKEQTVVFINSVNGSGTVNSRGDSSIQIECCCKDKDLRKRYYDLCEDYRKEFVSRYFTDKDSPIDSSYWIGGTVGELLEVNDRYFNFEDIRYAVDNNVPEDTLLGWCDYNDKVSGLGIDNPTFKEWCNGRPRLSDEQIKRIATIRHDLEREIEEARKSVKGV